MATKKRTVSEHIDEPKAFRFYLEGKTQREIAEVLGTSEQTISKWKKKHNWDQRVEERSASTRRSADILRRVIASRINKLENLEDDEIPKSIGDELHKLQLVLEKLDGHFDRLAFSIEIMEDFNQFLIQHFPEHVEIFHELLPNFLNEQGKKYGG